MSVETASMPWTKHARLGNFLVFCVQAASKVLHFQSQQVSCRKVCAFFMLLYCLHFEFRTGRQMCSWDSNHRWNKLFQWFNATRPGPVLPTPLWKLDQREEQPSSPAAATLTRLKSPQDQANSDLPGSRSLSFWQFGLNSDPSWNSIEIFQHLLWKGNSMGQKLLLQPEINFAPRCSASAFVPDTWQHKIRSLSHWQDDPGLQIWYDLKHVRDSKIKCQNSATQLF